MGQIFDRREVAYGTYGGIRLDACMWPIYEHVLREPTDKVVEIEPTLITVAMDYDFGIFMTENITANFSFLFSNTTVDRACKGNIVFYGNSLERALDLIPTDDCYFKMASANAWRFYNGALYGSNKLLGAYSLNPDFVMVSQTAKRANPTMTGFQLWAKKPQAWNKVINVIKNGSYIMGGPSSGYYSGNWRVGG